MGQGAQQQQQGGSGDNALAPLWIMAFLFAVALLLWYLFHEQIVSVVFKIKLFEAHLVGLFTPSLKGVILEMQTVPAESVTYDLMMKLSRQVGNVVRYPIMVILVLLGWMLYVSDVTARYKKTYDMKRLLNEESVNWPHVSPVLGLDLLEEPLDEGPWAMGTPPVDFAVRHKILKKEPEQLPTTWARRKEPPALTIKLAEAKEVFMMQMGAHWRGPKALNAHTKALFIIFAAKYHRDRDVTKKFLEQINLSSTTNKLNFSGINSHLRKYVKHEKIVKIMQEHAYVSTVMASMLQLSREDGVFPTADFLWLKPIDRPLWFMLNSVGRQTPFCDVSGPFAHWLVEKEFGRACLVPRVDAAVKGLEAAVKEVKYRPKEEEL